MIEYLFGHNLLQSIFLVHTHVPVLLPLLETSLELPTDSMSMLEMSSVMSSCFHFVSFDLGDIQKLIW
jgi:hypothetical protein